MQDGRTSLTNGTDPTRQASLQQVQISFFHLEQHSDEQDFPHFQQHENVQKPA